MANNYTDSFESSPYQIKSGNSITAAGMTAALNTREKVANKQDTINDSSAEYPSSKAVKSAISAAVSALETSLDSKQVGLPIGTILMYDGTSWTDNNTLPGWYKCDGQNGTPDLDVRGWRP